MADKDDVQLTVHFPYLPHEVLMERLMGHTTHDAASGCLLWKGCLQETGYGRMRLSKYGGGSLNYSPNKLLWFLKTGHRVLEPEFLQRTCSNRACIATEHMVLNNRQKLRKMTDDMVVEARQVFWGKDEPIRRRNHQPQRHALTTCAAELCMAEATLLKVLNGQPVNQAQWRNKELTIDSVRAAYQRHQQANAQRDACIQATHTYRSIADLYGLNMGQAQKMLNGETYRHIPMPKTALAKSRRQARPLGEIKAQA